MLTLQQTFQQAKLELVFHNNLLTKQRVTTKTGTRVSLV